MLRFAVIASLAVNIALGFLWWNSTPPSREPDLTLADSAPTATTASAASAPPAVASTPPTFSELLADSTLSDSDLIDRLRACHLPADIIRQIIRQRVHARFADPWQALVQDTAGQPYWNRPRSRIPQSTRRAMRELDRAENDALFALLGDDAFGANEGQLSVAEYDYLPSTKRYALSGILNDFGDLRGETLRDVRGMPLPGDQDILSFLHLEQDAEIRALLTPEEYLAYHRHHSPAALEVQNSLRGFPATEAEYLRLLELHAQFAAEHGPAPEAPALGPTALAARSARNDAWTEILSTFGASLEGERAEEWTLQTDGRYQVTERFGQQQQLDPTTIRALYHFERDFQARAAALLAHPANSSSAQLQIDRQALLQSADQTLQTLLPPAALQAYQRTSVGRQLRVLQESPPRP